MLIAGFKRIYLAGVRLKALKDFCTLNAHFRISVKSESIQECRHAYSGTKTEKLMTLKSNCQFNS
jgi:hypothetical protein